MIKQSFSNFFLKYGYLANNQNKYKFIIALSGGGDSLALAKLCVDFKLEHKNFEFICAIIDHSIAINSKEIALKAQNQAQSLGLEAIIITNTEKIIAPIQENARKIRYSLLFEFAKAQNANAILLGHNYDDQIETIAFRLLRKTSLYGLGGMNEIKLSCNFDYNIMLMRPILEINRDNLRQFLKANQIEYYDDPANENTNFSRVNIRKKIKTLNKPIVWKKLLNIGNNARDLRKIMDNWAYKYITNFSEEQNEIYEFKYLDFIKLPIFFQQYLLAIMINIFAIDAYLPSPKKIEKLQFSINQDNFKASNIGKIIIRKKNEKLIFTFAPKRKNQNLAIMPSLAVQKLRLIAICNQFEGFLGH